jgi:hypothetical protein
MILMIGQILKNLVGYVLQLYLITLSECWYYSTFGSEDLELVLE